MMPCWLKRSRTARFVSSASIIVAVDNPDEAGTRPLARLYVLNATNGQSILVGDPNLADVLPWN